MLTPDYLAWKCPVCRLQALVRADRFPVHCACGHVQLLPNPGLGDHVAAGLGKLGITKQRVSRLLGRPCKCRERQKRLNELGRVAGIGRGQAATAQPPSSNKSL
jgi:hypothetical protein